MIHAWLRIDTDSEDLLTGIFFLYGGDQSSGLQDGYSLSICRVPGTLTAT